MDGADIFSVTGAIGGAGHIFSLAYFRPPLAILVSITLRLGQQGLPLALAESAQNRPPTCLTGRRGVAASFGPVACVSARVFPEVNLAQATLSAVAVVLEQARAALRTTRIHTNRRAASEAQERASAEQF